jgi:hypothetical protein
MHAANVAVWVFGVTAIVAAAATVWRWHRLPLIAVRADQRGWRTVGSDAIRAFGAVVSAGLVSGLVVLGFGGRLVMRLLAVTSADAQGRFTEAGERVGEITAEGTIGFLIFVGLGGGMVTAFAFLLVRRWLPRTAGPAGLVTGVILIGTLGVLDPLSPDNVDFAILRPTWLAVASVVAIGMLFACTFSALAARLDATATGSGWKRWLPSVSVPLALLPPFGLFGVAYLAGRVAARGSAGRVLDRAVPSTAGRAAVVVATVATLGIVVAAAARIVTA